MTVRQSRTTPEFRRMGSKKVYMEWISIQLHESILVSILHGSTFHVKLDVLISGALCILLEVNNILKPSYNSPITGDFGEPAHDSDEKAGQKRGAAASAWIQDAMTGSRRGHVVIACRKSLQKNFCSLSDQPWTGRRRIWTLGKYVERDAFRWSKKEIWSGNHHLQPCQTPFAI